LGVVPDSKDIVDVETLRSALAELQDAKLRLQRDADRQVELLRARVLEQLLPVLDNLERCITSTRHQEQDTALLEGVRLVQLQFLRVLADFGLERVSAVGERFDPTKHDALAVVPTEDPNEDGVVVAEIEPAYKLGERVIRPAKVEVGRSARRPQA
jgi:molecular chaperone GrpE